MRSLWVNIIARDEEENIVEAIRSVSWADEVLVVLDERTTDRTAEKARELGARVVERPWKGYVAQRNQALELSAGPWILALDADERVTDELAREITVALGVTEDKPLLPRAWTTNDLKHCACHALVHTGHRRREFHVRIGED